ncbi:MAG: hypothetical protein WKH64_04980 [Chloroflexia bacterium]
MCVEHADSHAPYLYERFEQAALLTALRPGEKGVTALEDRVAAEYGRAVLPLRLRALPRREVEVRSVHIAHLQNSR